MGVTTMAVEGMSMAAAGKGQGKGGGSGGNGQGASEHDGSPHLWGPRCYTGLMGLS